VGHRLHRAAIGECSAARLYVFAPRGQFRRLSDRGVGQTANDGSDHEPGWRGGMLHAGTGQPQFSDLQLMTERGLLRGRPRDCESSPRRVTLSTAGRWPEGRDHPQWRVRVGLRRQ
jgi:hypothetical protein